MVAIIYAACFCELIYVFTCKYLAPFVVLKFVFLFALKVVESSYDGLITWFLALKPCDSNISVHPSWSYPAWVQMVGPSAATKKKQVYALAGFLVLCDLRSTELWIPSKEASITGRLFYQSQWCFLESKQLSSEQIMEPSTPRISSHRNQNWTEDYEQGWTVFRPSHYMNCVKDNNNISLDGAGTSIAASETIWNALGFNVSGRV